MFKKIFVSICSIVTVALCTLGIVACNGDVVKDKVEDNFTNDFNVVIDDSNNVQFGTMLEPTLRLSSTPVIVNDNGSVTKSITATLSPADAEIQGVRWSIEWVTAPSEGADINDYFSLDAGLDGTEKTCYVTCFKAFLGGEAKVIATTVDGGFKAECKVKYAGVPSSIGATYGDQTIGNFGSFHVTTGTTNKVIEINLSNALGEVGAFYKNLVLESVELKGQMNVNFDPNLNSTTDTVAKLKYNFETGYATLYEDGVLSTEAFLFNDETSKATYGIALEDFVDVSLNGTSLSLLVKQSPEGFYKETTSFVLGGKASLTFDSHVQISSSAYANPYFDIRIRVPDTEMYIIMSVYPQTGVTDIVLDYVTLTF